jgi:hypothetical protein
MAWKFFVIVSRLVFTGALLSPAVYLVRPETSRLDAFLTACSIAAGICEAARLALLWPEEKR